MNKLIKTFSLALLLCMPVAYGMQKTTSDSESDRLDILSDEDYGLPSTFFISDSDGSRAQTSDGALLDELSASGWDSDILENIHDRAIVRALLKDSMYKDMSVNELALGRAKGPFTNYEETFMDKVRPALTVISKVIVGSGAIMCWLILAYSIGDDF